MNRIVFAWVISLAVSACASRPSTHVVGRSLESLRRAAAEHPADLLAQRDRALAELVAPRGDLAVAERELRRLSTLLPGDPRVPFALAVPALARGQNSEAIQRLFEAVEAARTHRDVLGGPIAEIALARMVDLRDDVIGFPEQFRAVSVRIASDPGVLGAEATYHWMDTAIRWARERGRDEDERAWIAAVGCVTQWQVAGAFGPFPMIRFDETLPPESPGPWQHDYDVGPGRGRRATWTALARGCAANLGVGRQETGVFVAAADVLIDRERDVIVHVETPNVFSVLFDGVRVASLDGRTRPTGTAVAVPLHLLPGRHTLRVKIATRFSSPLLIAAVTDASGRAAATFELPTGAAFAEPPIAPPADDELERAGLTHPSDPFTRYIAAHLATHRRNPVAAREMLRPLGASSNAAPLALLDWSVAQTADPFLAPGVARDRARRGFESLVRTHPEFVDPYLSLAGFAGGEQRDDDALRMLRQATARAPNHPATLRALANHLLGRDWHAEVAEIVDRASTSLPDACWPRRLRAALAQARGHADTVRRMVDEVRICDALSDEAAQTAQSQRRWDDARQEFERLVSHDPAGRALRRAIVEVDRQQGALDRAWTRGITLLDENPEDTDLRSDLVDTALALDRTSEARTLLDREIARRPNEMSQLYRFRTLLAGREELAPWRRDGRAVLRAYRESNPQYDAASVLVLDYTVRRVFADGSALELTHNIFALQSQEGVDEHATVTLPGGAFLLLLRTHRADGRVLEPDSIARLDAVAFPDVHIGDAVEFEYVRALSATDLAPDGFTTERFYFRGFEEPYDRSEFVVVLPRDVASRVVIDPRGPAPETHRRVIDDALVEYRWIARQSARMTPEPRGVSAREFIPSITLGAGATWERFVDALRDRLADLDAEDPDALALARQVVGNARSPSERLRRLHRWVLDNIQQEGAGTPFASAPVMLAARRGHRTRILRYLLRLVGVPVQVALVRPGNGDQTVTALADDETFPSILLRVQTEHGWTWVTASERGASPAWLPIALYGQEALLLEPGAPRDRVPEIAPTDHTRAVRMHVVLDREGRARVDAEERMHGTWAVSWRESLRQIDHANLEREFEAYVGRLVTAASLQRVNITGEDDPDADVVLRYSFTAPSLAVAESNGLRFEGVFHAELGPAYVPAPRRTTPQYNAEALFATLDMDVDLAPGMRVPHLPARREGHAPGIDWSIVFEPSPTGFRFHRVLRIPPGRVRAQDYARFATEIRAADAADAQRVRIER